MATLSLMESHARDILSSVPLIQLSANEIRVRNVFWAMWSAALPVDRVEAISSALEGSECMALNMALSQMVRRKTLRTRNSNGVKLYEVNL